VRKRLFADTEQKIEKARVNSHVMDVIGFLKKTEIDDRFRVQCIRRIKDVFFQNGFFSDDGISFLRTASLYAGGPPSLA
jgi:hypothetical protein